MILYKLNVVKVNHCSTIVHRASILIQSTRINTSVMPCLLSRSGMVTGPRYQCDVSPEVTISYRVVQILVSVSEGPLILSISGFVEYASLFTIQYFVIYKPRYPLHLYPTYQMGFFYCTSSPKLKIKGPVKLDNERKLSGIHSLYV